MCVYKNGFHWKNISKEKIRRHVFAVYVLIYPQNLGAIGQISYEFKLFTESPSSEKKKIRENSAVICQLDG